MILSAIVIDAFLPLEYVAAMGALFDALRRFKMAAGTFL